MSCNHYEFPSKWIHGASSDESLFQVHRYAEDTFILRQSKLSNFEAPFLFLLTGSERALLLDTGAKHLGRAPHELREVIVGLLREVTKQQRQLPLIVAHTHAHGDHIAGDEAFRGQHETTLVEPTLECVKAFFGLHEWPEGSSTIDLGGRALTVLPLPGHEATHIAVYDARHGLLFTGDSLYPGLLTVRDWPAFRASTRRLQEFVETHDVQHVLGCHVEMTCRAGELYPLGTSYQPEEHALQLGRDDVQQLCHLMTSLGELPQRAVSEHFVITYIEPKST